MEKPHDIRVTNLVFGIGLRAGLLLTLAAAAFLALGYGDGFFPSS
jgi:hypothetical protein